MRDTLKSEKSEVYKWKDLVKELRSLLDGKNDEIERKREEVGKWSVAHDFQPVSKIFDQTSVQP